MDAGVILYFSGRQQGSIWELNEMLFFQIVRLFRELNIWVATAGAAITIPLMIFEIRRQTSFKQGKEKETFLRNHLDW